MALSKNKHRASRCVSGISIEGQRVWRHHRSVFRRMARKRQIIGMQAGHGVTWAANNNIGAAAWRGAYQSWYRLNQACRGMARCAHRSQRVFRLDSACMHISRGSAQQGRGRQTDGGKIAWRASAAAHQWAAAWRGGAQSAQQGVKSAHHRAATQCRSKAASASSPRCAWQRRN